MPDETIGVRLDVTGEEELVRAFDRASSKLDDFNRAMDAASDSSGKAAKDFANLQNAIGKLASQDKQNRLFEEAKQKLDLMTDAEKDAAAAAYELDRAQSQVDGSNKKMRLSLTDIKSGFEMAIAAARPFIDLAMKMISSASDLNETLNKSQVVFGDYAKSIEDMGNKAASSLGMSKNAAIAAAATYGNLFTSMGMSKDVSAQMSKDLVQLAADLGSFNNIPVADALEKIRAGLVGESEPLKSLGINLNEATLKAEALSLGLYSGKGNLEAAAKAQAAYSIMLKQSSSAQGDFARTAGGAANQQKILEATTADLMAEIGSGLLPVWLELLKAGNELLGTTNEIIQMTNKYSKVIKTHSDEIVKTAGSYEDYVREMIRANQVARGMQGTQEQVNRTIEAANGDLDLLARTFGFETLATFNATRAKEELNKVMAVTNVALAANSASLESLSNHYDDASEAGYRHIDASGAIIVAADMEKAAIDRLNLEMQTYTTRLMFNYAAAGLDAAAQRDLAVAMGLIDPASSVALAAIDRMKTGMDQGAFVAGAFNQAVAALNRSISEMKDKDITITTHMVTLYTTRTADEEGKYGETRYASGGTFVIPERYGYEGYPLGPGKRASGGERVIVLPKSMSAGPVTNNYSTANNYNLNVMTSQSPAVVQRSFAMMKMLSEG